MVQLLARGIQHPHLPVTPLELLTLGIICCACPTYGAWMFKPKDVMIPIALDIGSGSGCPKSKFEDRIPMGGTDLERPKPRYKLVMILTFIVCVLSGICHLLAWNFEFNTSIERLLWRISCVTCLLIPILFLFTFYLFPGYVPLDEFFFSCWIVPPLFCLYGIPRLYLIIEAFAGLRSVPLGVYQTVPWSQCFPHIQ